MYTSTSCTYRESPQKLTIVGHVITNTVYWCMLVGMNANIYMYMYASKIPDKPSTMLYSAQNVHWIIISPAGRHLCYLPIPLVISYSRRPKIYVMITAVYYIHVHV